MARFGSLAGVLAASPAELKTVAGVGEAVTLDLKLLHEMTLRIGRQAVAKRTVITSWSQLLDYVKIALAHEVREQFRVIFLDKKNQLIADEVMNHGTVDHAPVYPREVMRRALELSASSVILVHNHPSGDPTPSSDWTPMRLLRITLAAGAIMALAATGAIAQAGDEPACFADEAAPNERMESCTTVSEDQDVPANIRAVALTLRASQLNDLGMTDKALNDLAQAIKLEPKLPFACLARGAIRADQGDFKGALADVDAALKLEPKNAETLVSRGLYRMMTEDKDALADFDRAISIDPQNADHLQMRSIARRHAGDLDGAMADAELAVKFAPSDPRSFSGRGDVYAARQDNARALADYDRVA